VQNFVDASFLDRFWNNVSHQEEFKVLNAQLSSNAANLNLALNITQLFDRHQDMTDLDSTRIRSMSKTFAQDFLANVYKTEIFFVIRLNGHVLEFGFDLLFTWVTIGGKKLT
jgi:hypothetical protein